MNTHEITITPQEVSAAVQQNQQKGWQLVDTVPQEDGKLLLRFQRVGALQSAPQYTAPVNPDVAWLELLGLLGFLGIGYMAANRVGEGVFRLLGFIMFSVFGWLVVVVLTAVIIGFCLIPVMLAAQIGIPIWSALTLKRELETLRLHSR